jgi:ankyrin repeat protein
VEGDDAGIADVNCRDDEGETALHKAAYINNTTVSKYLIQMGGDLDAQDEEGDTPLHIAADNNHTAFAELVLDAGAKVDIKNKEGDTPCRTCSLLLTCVQLDVSIMLGCNIPIDIYENGIRSIGPVF